MDTESKMKDQIYNRLLEERIVFLSGEVRDDMANMVCAHGQLDHRTKEELS